MENFGKLMTILLIMAITPIINGFVFLKLWHWFIMPTFNTNPLRLIESIGVLLVLSFILYRKPKNNDTDSGKFWENLWRSVALTISIGLFTLGFGWIIQLFM